jgi:hypothetical protein
MTVIAEQIQHRKLWRKYFTLPLIYLTTNCYTKWFLLNYPFANEVAKGYSNASIRPSVRPSHPCEHSRINILQWILTKLGTYLVLKRICSPIDFQGHRSKVKVTGSNFYHITSLWTLESTSFNGFWLNMVHTYSLGESGTLLIFKVIGQRLRSLGNFFYRVTSLWTL